MSEKAGVEFTSGKRPGGAVGVDSSALFSPSAGGNAELAAAKAAISLLGISSGAPHKRQRD